MSLLYFTLCCYGLTHVLVYGKIFEKLRPQRHFFHCPMCIGFWVGVFLFGLNTFTELFTFKYTLFNALLLGSFSSGTSYILSQLFGDHGLRTSGYHVYTNPNEAFDMQEGHCSDCGHEEYDMPFDGFEPFEPIEGEEENEDES